MIDVSMSDGLQFEGLFTHQHAHFLVPPGPLTPATRWQLSVDHWQAGGLQEFGRGRLRPFLTGTLGLTRYAVEGDNEVRFSLGAGGGTKLFPTDHIGLRLDGRLFATFVDTDGSILCSFGRCFFGVRASVVWQAELTAGVVFAFH